MGHLNPEEFLPKPRERHEEPEREILTCSVCLNTFERPIQAGRKPSKCPVCSTKPKRRASKPVSPEARALWMEFYDEFKAIHGYPYPGEFYKETKIIDKLLALTGIDGPMVRKMMALLFGQEYRGYYNRQPVSVFTLYNNRSRLELLDRIHHKNQEKQEEPMTSGTWLDESD